MTTIGSQADPYGVLALLTRDLAVMKARADAPAGTPLDAAATYEAVQSIAQLAPMLGADPRMAAFLLSDPSLVVMGALTDDPAMALARQYMTQACACGALAGQAWGQSSRVAVWGQASRYVHAQLAGPSGPDVQLDVPWVSQFDPRVSGCGTGACYRAVEFMGEQAGFTFPASTENRIQVAVAEDELGGVVTTASRAKDARDFIDAELDAGRPVGAGFSHSVRTGDGNRDEGITDHFGMITGRHTDEAGDTYYVLLDPSSESEPTISRLYPDETTGNLFREGQVGEGYAKDRRLELSMLIPADA